MLETNCIRLYKFYVKYRLTVSGHEGFVCAHHVPRQLTRQQAPANRHEALLSITLLARPRPSILWILQFLEARPRPSTL